MTNGSTPSPYPGETRNDYRDRLKRQGYRANKFGREDRRILKCLKDAGIEVERAQTRDLRIVGAITRKSVVPTNYRRIAMLPFHAEAAADLRSIKAGELIEEMMCEQRYPRYLVLHPRPPAELTELADHLKAINDDIDALQRAAKRHGGGVPWVSIEAKYQADTGTFHVHANLIVCVPSKSFEKLKRMADRRYAREGWYDAGKVRDPRKVASYITKAPDLRSAPAPALVAYYHATEGRQLHRSSVCSNSEELVCDEMGEHPQELSEDPLCDTQCGDVGEDPTGSSEPQETVSQTPPRPATSDRRAVHSDTVENKIIRFLGVRFLTDHAEPVFLVEGYTECPTTQRGRLGLLELKRAANIAKSEWLGNGGSEDYFPCPTKTPQNPDPQLIGSKWTERGRGYSNNHGLAG